MVNRYFMGWYFLIGGLIFVIFNLPLAHLQSAIDKAIVKAKINLKWYRIIYIIGGSLTALAGLFLLLKH